MSELQESVPPDSSDTSMLSAYSASTPTLTSETASGKPEISRPSSLPKPSGLKLPSKIGRLCSNSTPKPAVPVSPRADGSSDTVRKLSDELSRKHLSDLIEAEEDEVTSSLPDRPRTHRKASTASSSHSGTSMDALWEKHPRRLSEAGLRRSSDHSVVLTEDTDSFIIGERVWVGGTKPGQIAYIGETQFAPGDWAGIVLDEPIGKNDGSVAGVRYFQCAEKRGVFSRLTRLTRVSLAPPSTHDASPVSDAGSVFERPPSGASRSRRTLSPNGSVRSVVSSKMNTSISTTANGELRLGDRVIVSSSRGSKAGILKYVGVTDFATGVWAGVELDDPLGKNDGSVDGKRYFECAPRFGLFAPISKVSRSPSNRKPGSCAIHSNGRATPLRRSNSRDSLTSLGTSITSSRAAPRFGAHQQRVGAPRASSTPVSAKNALQELLREKQAHLERLMRERELERQEIAKVSLQAERAESALTLLKKETTQSISENEKLKMELDKLNKVLEDERQKVEDLMFRNEEENINKEDYYKYKEMMEKEKQSNEQKIRELEAEIVLQSARAEATAATLRALEEQRHSETATLIEQHKEELTAAQTLSYELQKLLDEAYALLKEKDNEKDSIGKSMSEELAKIKAESEKALNEAKTKMAIAQTEFDTQMSVLSSKLQLAESKLDTEKQNSERLNKENSQTIMDLNTKLTQIQAIVDDKTLELNKLLGSSKEHEVNLSKEITKLKMELSAKVLDIEQLEDAKRKQEEAYKSLYDEINKVKEEMNTKVNEYEGLLNELSQQNENNKSEIFQLQQSLANKTKDYERLLNESNSSTTNTEQIVSEYKQTLHERDKEIIKLKNEYEQAFANFNINHSKIAEEHKKEIEERNIKIEQLLNEIKSHQTALDQSKIEFDTLNTKFTVNIDELKSLKEENDVLKQSVNKLTQANNDLKAKISGMELEIGELRRQYDSATEKCKEIIKAKEKIENEYMNLTGQATDSNEQFNKLSQHLKDTEKELQEQKDKQREAANNHGRIEQEMKQRLFKLQEEFSAERGQLVRTVDEYAEKLATAENKLKEFEAHAYELNIRQQDMQSSSDKVLDENSILKREIETIKLKEQELNKEFQSIRKKLEVEIDKYKEEISILKAEGATSEVKLMEKVDQLTEAQNDLNNKLEEARKHEDSLQKILTDTTTQLNCQKIQFEKEITQLKNQLATINEESSNYKSEEARLNKLLEEKQTNIKDLTLKFEMLEVDLKSNLELVTEKDRQLSQNDEELNKVTNYKNQLEVKLNNATLETNTLKQQYESLIANSSADGNVMKEQLGQLEKVKSEIAALVLEKVNLESKCTGYSEELRKIHDIHTETLEKLKYCSIQHDELKMAFDDKENLLKTQTEMTETEINKLKGLQEEVGQLKQEIIKKDDAIQEKESHLKKLTETLQSGSNETQQLIAQIQQESTQKFEKYIKEIESLNNNAKDLQNRVTEQENQIKKLELTNEKTTEKVKELQEVLDKSERDIKQLTDINEGQKSNYEDLNKQLRSQFDEYKKDSKRSKHDLRATLEESEKELKESKETIKLEIEKQAQMQQKLGEAEKNILDLSQKLELVTVQQSAKQEKDGVLEKITLELQATRQSSADALAKSEEVVNNLKTDIERKIKDLRQKDELIIKLQEQLKKYLAKLEIIEREKIMLQKEAEKRNVRDKNDNNAMGILGQGDTATHKTLEEKEMLDGQVSFLNSVIVDMQRKNEQLIARVQALESGSVTESPAYNNGRTPKVVAPRLFCDICDIFDAHDTEDCPKQAGEPDAPPPPANRKPPPAPRPYCDICEVFGHTTEDCDEEETF